MEFLFPLLVLVAIFHVVKIRDQRRRILLLGGYLQQYQIEKLMETLLEGYLRALGEKDEERRQSIWRMLEEAETHLSDQLKQLAQDFSKIWGDHVLVSTLPIALPLADKLAPQATFDMRRALQLHADGIAQVVANEAGRSERDKAFMLTAEILLLQHTCHWFCRSKTVASARMVARHRTHYEQRLDAVSPTTREAYRRLFR